MTNAEGFLGIILIIYFFIFIAGTVILTITYALMKWSGRRGIQAAIAAFIMAAGFLPAMGLDAPMLLAMTLAGGVPGSVLMAAFISSPRAAGVPPFSRVLACHVVVSLVTMILPFLLVWSGLSMVEEIYRHTPLSNSIIYAGAMALDLVLATIVFRILNRQGQP